MDKDKMLETLAWIENRKGAAPVASVRPGARRKLIGDGFVTWDKESGLLRVTDKGRQILDYRPASSA